MRGGSDLRPAEVISVEQRTQAGGTAGLSADFFMYIYFAIGCFVFPVGEATQHGAVG